MTITKETPTPITFEEYARARDALDKLVLERATVLDRGLDALRRWLAAGAGERWLHYEAIVQRARAEDLALTMWWEHQWRRERSRRQRAEEKARRQAAPAPVIGSAEPAKDAVSGHTKTAPPSQIVRPGASQRLAPTPARSFSPTGQVWRR